MNRTNESDIRWYYSTGAVIPLFIFIGILSFGLLIPFLGFYWDDFPISWITETYGRAGLERYFSTNRPIWGLLFQATAPLLGSEPWHWQVYALAWRILSAIAFWYFLRNLWPRKPSVALFAGIAFLVYPGFTQQWISIIYSHFFIIMTAFMMSLALTVIAIRTAYEQGKSPRTNLFAALALFLSFINLISLEYFFTLELIRLFVIWFVIKDYVNESKLRLQKTIVIGIPYLLLLFTVAIWRVFLFPYQTNNYQLSLLDRFSVEPINALVALVINVLTSIWKVSVLAWINVIKIPDVKEVGRITVIISYALVFTTFLAIASWITILRKRSNASNDFLAGDRVTQYQVLMLAGAALLLAGWAFWLIDLSPDLSFSLDRFTLPFMMGTALLLIGTIEILPFSFVVKSIFLLGLISLSVGSHFRLANAYRRDWETQRRFFWQLKWRVPQLRSGTIVLANELPVTYYSDNSLTAPLNWIYAPENRSESMAYLLVYPARRLGSSLPELERNQLVDVDYLAATFRGSTSQAVTVYYDPPACLRVLDNNLDALNHMLPLLMQHSAEISDQENILWEVTVSQAAVPEILYPEEKHGWCFYFEKAELARQQGDWEGIVALGETAFALGDYPNDPAERLPFIEGYARIGRWERALQLTQESLDVSPRMIPVLCLLWERIEQATVQTAEKNEAFGGLSTWLSCSR
jgi:hypothetical protein